MVGGFYKNRIHLDHEYEYPQWNEKSGQDAETLSGHLKALVDTYVKKLLLSFLCLFIIHCYVTAQEDASYRTFQEGFQNPPPASRPNVTYWFLGGYVDTLRLKEELLSFKKAGISGFTIFEIGSRDTVHIQAGPAYLSEESLKILKCAVREAGKLGMEVGVNTASSWNAGGSWIPPEYASKSIFFSKTETDGGKELKMKLPFPAVSKKDAWGKQRRIQYRNDGKPVFYKEIAVLAVPAGVKSAGLDTGMVINVSAFFDPATEMLHWNAPAGNWDILRYVCSNSGENLVLPTKYSAGPIMDHYDAEATEFHFMYIINKLEATMGDLRETALKSLYMASYEAKALTWTTTLPEVFKQINGYPVEKFLPALFPDNPFTPALTAHFKADFQKTISELMINNFYKKSREICHQHGLKNNCEAGGPGLPLHNVPVEPLKALGALDIPRGEFWINHSRFNEKGIDISRVVKEVSSASHSYNQGLVEMEAFTTFQHWQEGPFEMKPLGDRAFCEGMNKVVIHGSAHNPSGTGFPGIAYHAGTHFNDKRVWWPKIKPFNDYLARVSYILQKADFVADVLYYYGDTIPNYGGHKNSRFTAGPGYDYEIVNTEILKTVVVKDGKLVIPSTGATFRILALTDEKEIDPEVFIKLDELARQGAVIIGEKPAKAAVRKVKPGMPDMGKMLDRLWTTYQKGELQKMEAKVYSGVTPSSILGDLNLAPDFSYPGEALYLLDYVHYAKDDLDFYFIRNTTDGWISRSVRFRQQDKLPELWNPVSGRIVPVVIYDQDQTGITLPVTLAPYGSTFIVFKRDHSDPWFTREKSGGQHPPLLAFTAEGIFFLEDGVIELSGPGKTEAVHHNMVKEQTLEGAWEVFFPKGWGAPERAIFPKLTSWTDSENKGIRYFSGIARYEKSFVVDIHSSSLENPKIYLDLCDLSNVGEAWLNDQPLGITWTKPYRFDVSNVIKPGPNKLVIEIANTWSNRIVGDAQTGENYTSTNITSTVVKNGFFIDAPWTEVPLIESGLFGPVTLITVNPIRSVTSPRKKDPADPSPGHGEIARFVN